MHEQCYIVAAHARQPQAWNVLADHRYVQAWDTLTWFAALIGMASFLNKFGFIAWFSNKVRSS